MNIKDNKMLRLFFVVVMTILSVGLLTLILLQPVSVPQQAKAQSSFYTVTGTAVVDWDHLMFPDAPPLLLSAYPFTPSAVIDIELVVNMDVYTEQISIGTFPTSSNPPEPYGNFDSWDYSIDVEVMPGDVIAEYRRLRFILEPSVDGQEFYNEGELLLSNIIDGYSLAENGAHMEPDSRGFSFFRDIEIEGYQVYLPVILR